MGLFKLAVADAAITFLWVAATATLGAATNIIASYVGVEGAGARGLITFVLVAVLIVVFSTIGQKLGGASWNPTALLAFSAAGVSNDSLFSFAVRFPAQAVGAAGGALSILELMPETYKHTLGGPRLKVDVQSGLIAEGFLTFAITFVVMWTVLKGPRSAIWKTVIITTATVFLVTAGSKYTGPAMNSAVAFGWAYANNRHNTWDHLYVYWIAPHLGALAAAWLFSLFFSVPKEHKEKSA
ncbi:hypothetical protein O6H91_14G017900 [Diphasiastrum complanatum]|uniref:Uncharacterized protein n=2 Tax=Diphasiastrum complanatum TaxID=34168 RepID=A0ACC2BM07_DIPCM|nr:hypothetical protein O6H91_14G017900 [Diphasiastrum complanatum]KAJ7530761.1 hypothetical protein O6H91_14G017900 [Diphasiastrum complanatum]